MCEICAKHLFQGKCMCNPSLLVCANLTNVESSRPATTTVTSCCTSDNGRFATLCLPGLMGLRFCGRQVSSGEAIGKTEARRYLPDDFLTAESLVGAADHKLFVCIAGNPHHVFRRYYHEKSPLVTTCAPGLITFYSLKRTMETLSPGPYMLNSTLRIFFTLFKSLISVAVTLSTE